MRRIFYPFPANRCSHLHLIMVTSLAVVVGLVGAGPPARAALAAPSSALSHSVRVAGTSLDVSAITPPSGDFTFDLDFGVSLGDPTTVQDVIDRYQGQNARLSDTIRRSMDEYDVAPALGAALGITVPNATSGWQDFDGTMTLDPGGTGLSLTIPAAEVQTSLTFWQAVGANVLGWLVTIGLQVACDLAVPALHLLCSFVAGFMGAFVADWVKLAFDGLSLTDPANLGPTLADALVGGVSGVASEVVVKFLKTTFLDILKNIGNWIVVRAKTAWQFITGSNYLGSFGQLLVDSAPYIEHEMMNMPAPGGRALSGLPCDVYAFGGTPCTATYSMDRALYIYYNGPLYQVTRASDNTTRDIGLLAPGGDVNASEQDSFCAGTSCTITKIYDQSPDWNDLTVGPAGQADPADHAAQADALPIKIGGNEAYGVDFTGGVGYRDDGPGNRGATGVATGNEPEGMYMVASGTNVNSQCCFDFGNAETDNNDDNGGAMDAVNFGTHCYTNYGAKCNGAGPWVQADLENGLFQGAGTNQNDTSNTSDFVTAMLKNNGTSSFELEGGNAQSGSLSTLYNGALPGPEGGNKWAPMSKQGAIILGIGGDNSNNDVGSFFEGVMTDGTPTDAADEAVQASIVAANYAGDSAGALLPQNAGAAVVHQGYTSVYTVDAKNGDLQETFLSAQGAAWKTQDLTKQPGGGGPPPVKPGTTPVAVVHDGYTSVFTISASDNHVWETYLSNVGNTWASHDLTVIASTPPSKVTPSALFHGGYTTVYTIDASNGHLQTTYLTAIGAAWLTADLTAQTPGAPAAQPGTSPVSIFHDGYTSVFTVGTGHDIWETYLSGIGGTWAAHDITLLSNGPQTTSTVTAVFHQGYLSVYAAGDPSRHLWELYLPAINDAWKSQDLTAGGPKTPPVAPGTSPAGLFHTGYTSVYTVDMQTMHLQETYLSNIGNSWATQDFSRYQVPPTTETPIALVHPGTTGALDRTSVFTINQFDNDLQDTDLVAINDQWQTQDLTFETSGPPVMVDASPTASWSVAADGVTYVFTLDPSSGHLVVSYLTAQGAAWQTEDLTKAGVAPTPNPGTMPVAVAWAGHVTVFSVGDTHGDLWETTLSGNGGTWAGTDLTAVTGGPTTGVTPTAVFHGGEVSAYTVADGGNANVAGDLEEYFLPLGSTTWSAQDDTVLARGPQVAADTSPVALYHDGYVSVYLNSNSGNDLEEYYLAAIGGAWSTDDLTRTGGAPTLAVESSPTALYHSGYTSVYEIVPGGAVWATYLTAIGDSWASQDLTTIANIPGVPVNYATSPQPLPSTLAAVYHSGYTSLFTVDDGGDLNETYLPAIGGTWQTLNLATVAQVPQTAAPLQPSPLVHYAANGGLTWTTVYTINGADPNGGQDSGPLQGTYLPKIGDSWTTQALPN